MTHRPRIFRTITAGALSAAAATAAAAPVTAATVYPVQLCATATAAAGIWSRSAGLPSNAHTIECPASGGLPASLPSPGNRGAAIFPPPDGLTSSAGDPSAELRVTVPASVTVTGGSVSYRGGSGSMAWRAYLRANGTTIAGCRAYGTTGADACAYDPTFSYFANAVTAAVPSGTTSLTAGLTCESVDAFGQANPSCGPSTGVFENGAYSAVVGGSLAVSDAAAPTGSAVLEQTTAVGTAATWTRRRDARVRVLSLSVADVGRGVCGLRLAPAGASPSATPWAAWSTTPNTAAWRQCDGISAGTADVSDIAREGVQDVELTATDSSDSSDGTGNRTVVATGTVRIDDTPPTISFQGLATRVGPDARVRVAPAIADALSGLASSHVGASTQTGADVPIDSDGYATIPAGETVTVFAAATDRVGLTTSVTEHVTADPRPVDPGTPIDPSTPTNPGTPTTPTGPGTPTNPAQPTDPGTPTTPIPPTDPSTPTDPGKPTSPTTPARARARCKAIQRSTVTRAWWTRRSRKLTATGCRRGQQTLRLQVQMRVKSARRTKTVTRTYSLTGQDPVWTRSFRTRKGDVPLRVRVLHGGAPSSWRTVAR